MPTRETMFMIKDGAMRRFLCYDLFASAAEAEAWATRWVGAAGFVIVKV